MTFNLPSYCLSPKEALRVFYALLAGITLLAVGFYLFGCATAHSRTGSENTKTTITTVEDPPTITYNPVTRLPISSIPGKKTTTTVTETKKADTDRGGTIVSAEAVGIFDQVLTNVKDNLLGYIITLVGGGGGVGVLATGLNKLFNRAKDKAWDESERRALLLAATARDQKGA